MEKQKMKLIVMYKDKRTEEFIVYRVFQDDSLGMEYLYYEESAAEQGNGKFINTNDLLCWGIKSLN